MTGRNGSSQPSAQTCVRNLEDSRGDDSKATQPQSSPGKRNLGGSCGLQPLLSDAAHRTPWIPGGELVGWMRALGVPSFLLPQTLTEFSSSTPSQIRLPPEANQSQLPDRWVGDRGLWPAVSLCAGPGLGAAGDALRPPHVRPLGWVALCSAAVMLWPGALSGSCSPLRAPQRVPGCPWLSPSCTESPWPSGRGGGYAVYPRVGENSWCQHEDTTGRGGDLRRSEGGGGSRNFSLRVVIGRQTPSPAPC